MVSKNILLETLERDHLSSVSFFKERGTMLKIISVIFIFGFIFLNISNAPQKDWTDDIKLDITFPDVQPTITYIDTTEVTCLAKNMYFEARSEGVAGLVATTQVVYNRLESEDYPNTICGVIEQAKLSQWWLKEKGIKKPIKNKCQFSWFCDGYSDEPKDEKTYMRFTILQKNLLQVNTKI